MLRMCSVAMGLVSVFFVFWTGRLLAVTGLLLHTRPGGQGAFVGAVVFPVLAIACAWASRRCWRRASARPGRRR
jgi:membrane protein implicated in regulation of membrane protease activity